jgi:hypothetical protein
VGLLAPIGLWLGLSLAALIAIYLRARSRPTLEVSSLTLFEETKAPVARSKVLRLDALFWLEAAALTALTLITAGFYLREARPAITVQHQALMFDLSASMGATDTDGTRLAAAQRAALALVDGSPAGHRFSVIAYALDASVTRVESDRKSDVRAAIMALRPTAVPLRPAALGLALADAAGVQQIDLFSDHPPSEEMLREARAQAVVKIHVVGEPADNLAIVSLEPGTPKSVEGRCLVRSFVTSPHPAELRIDLAGREVFRSPLMLEPRARLMVRFGPLHQGGVVHARLLGADGLAADNDRYAIAPSVNASRALVVSNDNAVRDDLARILLAVNPAYRVVAIDGSPVALNQQRGQSFDLAVLHESAGTSVAAAARLFVYPQSAVDPGDVAPVRILGLDAASELRGRAGAAPLALPVPLGPARLLGLPGWMEALAVGAAAGGDASFPLSAVGRTRGGAIGVIAFDVRNHLLLDPDRMEALLLTIDAVRRLTAPSDRQVVTTGEFVSAATFAPATLIAPDGVRIKLTPDQWGVVHFRPLQAGRHLMIVGRRTIDLYANYYDEGESDLAVAPSAGTGDNRAPAAEPLPRGMPQSVPQTLSLGLMVLILLLAESLLIVRRQMPWKTTDV